MTTLTRSSATRHSATAILWALQLGTAAMFLFAGTLKVIGVPMMVDEFARIGLGQWFRYFTGGLELVSAVLILIPSFAVFGGVALAATMVGAILTHLFVIGGSPAVPVILLASSAWIAWTRRNG